MSLKICSINVNGFRDSSKFKNKRDTILAEWRKGRIDLAFLQETHIVSKSEEKRYFKNWDWKAFSSFGSNRARGGSTLISKFLGYKVVRNEHDWEGRCIFLDIDIADYKFWVINIYAANNASERKKFFRDMDVILLTRRQIIWGGDFNCFENLALDRKGRRERDRGGWRNKKPKKWLWASRRLSCFTP